MAIKLNFELAKAVNHAPGDLRRTSKLTLIMVDLHLVPSSAITPQVVVGFRVLSANLMISA